MTEEAKTIEHIIKQLAKFHGEPNLAFYKELVEELFCRYAGYQDYAAGGNVLNHIIARSFENANDR